MRAYVDSDILIWHLRGERKAMRFLQRKHYPMPDVVVKKAW